MEKKMGWVIKAEGCYVSNRAFTKTDDDWLFMYYTGDTTGFTFWIREDTVNKVLIDLQKLNKEYNFNRTFYKEYIDLKTVKLGKCIVTKANLHKNDNNNLISA
jgi:hypothetical protein